MTIRPLEPEDYLSIITQLDDWWGGRSMADMLPRLFFVHFRPTSFAAEEGGRLVGFIVGLISQTDPDQAYCHFIGLHPDHRGQGVGRRLYQALFQAARARGCTRIGAVTSPVNRASIAFHRRLGFEAKPQAEIIDGLPVAPDYDGPGQDRVVFLKRL